MSGFKMRVICKVDGVAATTNGFHDNGIYDVIGKQGNGFLVHNDNGHERFILLDVPSPHIQTRWVDGKCCGHFESVT